MSIFVLICVTYPYSLRRIMYPNKQKLFKEWLGSLQEQERQANKMARISRDSGFILKPIYFTFKARWLRLRMGDIQSRMSRPAI